MTEQVKSLPPAANSWLQIQSILNSINHMLIFLVAAFFFVLARSLNFQDTAMHMFMTGIGVSSSVYIRCLKLYQCICVCCAYSSLAIRTTWIIYIFIK